MVVLPDRALRLPTFSHVMTVNKTILLLLLLLLFLLLFLLFLLLLWPIPMRGSFLHPMRFSRCSFLIFLSFSLLFRFSCSSLENPAPFSSSSSSQGPLYCHYEEGGGGTNQTHCNHAGWNAHASWTPCHGFDVASPPRIRRTGRKRRAVSAGGLIVPQSY